MRSAADQLYAAAGRTEPEREAYEALKIRVRSDGGSSSYYELPENPKDLMDLIEFKRMSFGQGNIFKAAYRLGDKEGIDEAYDLRKIIFFAERRLAELARAERKQG